MTTVGIDLFDSHDKRRQDAHAQGRHELAVERIEPERVPPLQLAKHAHQIFGRRFLFRRREPQRIHRDVSVPRVAKARNAVDEGGLELLHSRRSAPHVSDQRFSGSPIQQAVVPDRRPGIGLTPQPPDALEPAPYVVVNPCVTQRFRIPRIDHALLQRFEGEFAEHHSVLRVVALASARQPLPIGAEERVFGSPFPLRIAGGFNEESRQERLADELTNVGRNFAPVPAALFEIPLEFRLCESVDIHDGNMLATSQRLPDRGGSCEQDSNAIELAIVDEQSLYFSHELDVVNADRQPRLAIVRQKRFHVESELPKRTGFGAAENFTRHLGGRFAEIAIGVARRTDIHDEMVILAGYALRRSDHRPRFSVTARPGEARDPPVWRCGKSAVDTHRGRVLGALHVILEQRSRAQGAAFASGQRYAPELRLGQQLLRLESPIARCRSNRKKADQSRPLFREIVRRDTELAQEAFDLAIGIFLARRLRQLEVRQQVPDLCDRLRFAFLRRIAV
ncbi:MAG TPA: hypothetical protein VLV78_06520 [Thermoanaerobaculia bacterium]|nr:hypothetical protein [Thermoanaerobaculia bacterium]